MVVIFSNEADRSTFDVLRWIHATGTDVLLLTETPRVFTADGGVQVLRPYLTWAFEDGAFRCGDFVFDFARPYALWYRRNNYPQLSPHTSGLEACDPGQVAGYAERELQVFKEFLYRKLARHAACTLGTWGRGNLNKPLVLELARDCGLDVPDSWILTDRDALLQVLRTRPALILKPLADVATFTTAGGKATNFPRKVTLADARGFPAVFGPTLFQEYIDTRTEIRVFTVGSYSRSMLALKTEHAAHLGDYRRSLGAGYPRYMPYALDPRILARLQALLDELGLDTSSTDFLLKDGRYYFIETNPVGQFGMLSNITNTALDAVVARHLVRGIIPLAARYA